MVSLQSSRKWSSSSRHWDQSRIWDHTKTNTICRTIIHRQTFVEKREVATMPLCTGIVKHHITFCAICGTCNLAKWYKFPKLEKSGVFCGYICLQHQLTHCLSSVAKTIISDSEDTFIIDSPLGGSSYSCRYCKGSLYSTREELLHDLGQTLQRKKKVSLSLRTL